jgi:hypothetical protein
MHALILHLFLFADLFLVLQRRSQALAAMRHKTGVLKNAMNATKLLSNVSINKFHQQFSGVFIFLLGQVAFDISPFF